MQVKIDFQPEICCDECYDIIHNHFNCPACKTKDASTSIYGESWDVNDFYCEKCKVKFKRVKEDIWEFNNENSQP